MTDKEAMKLALEYIESNAETKDEWDIVDALRQAIKQAEKQEPVAWINAEKRTFEWNGPVLWNTPTIAVLNKIPLYTHPPQRTEENT
jgi:hypothetical protein